ncbi:Uncharacterised protein [Pseudomonas aeruginosa]|nr:Uncharacterised protein [Pseudomonas aeruginosa]
MANLRRSEQTGFPRNREGPARHAPDPLASTVFPGPRAARQRCQPGGHGGPGQRQSQPGHRPGRHQPAPGPARRRGQGRLGGRRRQPLAAQPGDRQRLREGRRLPGRARRQHPPGRRPARPELADLRRRAADPGTGRDHRQRRRAATGDQPAGPRHHQRPVDRQRPAGAAHPPAGGQRPVHRRQLDRRIELRDITDLRGTIKVWGH